MSKRRSAWIDRRGQHGAAAAIDQVIERQPHAGEQVQHLADDLIEDSPYQARQSFSTASVEELAQGMRQAGFQGVLIVRPHSEPARQRRGIVQLVYGHRRRVAWRQVCIERGESCLVPVVVRLVNDAQLLTIGAQENLQRQDLDPVEEAQIVAWHERLFYEKNQAEIGAMLGKSSDWVSVRSRIHKLPDALKERLRQRPRAIKQVLELATLYQRQPQMALELADRVVNEQLTVEGIRAILDRQAEDQDVSSPREKKNNRRTSATSVQNITKNRSMSPSGTLATADLSDDTATERGYSLQKETLANWVPGMNMLHNDEAYDSTDLRLLRQAVAVLADVATRADTLPNSQIIDQALDEADQSLRILRQIRVTRQNGRL